MARNMILIGQAEEIDPVLPQVRKILAADGIYLARDTAKPEYTIPLSVSGGRIHSMQVNSELDPERFLPTVEFHGPYFGDPDAGERGRLLEENAILRAVVERSLSWLTSYPGGGARAVYEQARAALGNPVPKPCNKTNP